MVITGKWRRVQVVRTVASLLWSGAPVALVVASLYRASERSSHKIKRQPHQQDTKNDNVSEKLPQCTPTDAAHSAPNRLVVLFTVAEAGSLC
jgi:hypothetical protein